LSDTQPKDNEDKPNSSELFELLGHPARVKIIELLSEHDQSFSDLKRKIGIESSGHLQFHLSKLEPRLVKLASDGKNYTLTDEGREALRLITEVLESKSEIVVKPKSGGNGKFFDRRFFLRTTIVTLIIILIGFGVYSGIVLAFSPGNNIYQSSNCTKTYPWQSIPPFCYQGPSIVLGEEYFAEYNLTTGHIELVEGLNMSQYLVSSVQGVLTYRNFNSTVTCLSNQTISSCMNSDNNAVKLFQPSTSPTSCAGGNEVGMTGPNSCPKIPLGMIDVTNSPYFKNLMNSYCGACSGPIDYHVNIQSKTLQSGSS
jgi:DNA-binding HxlR family transcriptional regulator